MIIEVKEWDKCYRQGYRLMIKVNKSFICVLYKDGVYSYQRRVNICQIQLKNVKIWILSICGIYQLYIKMMKNGVRRLLKLKNVLPKLVSIKESLIMQKQSELFSMKIPS